MKPIARLVLVLALLAALLPASGAFAQAPSYDPTCDAVAAQLGATARTGLIDGAITCVITPPKAKWNRDVVLFAHGYVDARQPIGIPWESQLITADNNLPALILNLGYAFATTSYRKNGLAVQEGVQDVVNLANAVRAENKRVRRIYLTGASEGGLVTALAAERFPQTFAGALSTCGPIGNFQYQVQYWGNFRVGFDTALPANPLRVPIGPYGLSSPIYIDPFVVQNWEMLAAYIANELATNPASGAAAVALLDQLGVPYDPADLTTVGESVLGLLYYNVEATNDGRLTLVPGTTPADLPAPGFKGNPYIPPFDLTPLYPEYFPTGIQPDPAALAAIANLYETTGSPGIQTVVMHTTGDPIIPFQHSLLYTQKAVQSGSLGKLALIPIDRYGHCAFEPAEIVFGFYTMVLRSTLLPFSQQQIAAALPDAAQQEKFKELKEKNTGK